LGGRAQKKMRHYNLQSSYRVPGKKERMETKKMTSEGTEFVKKNYLEAVRHKDLPPPPKKPRRSRTFSLR